MSSKEDTLRKHVHSFPEKNYDNDDPSTIKHFQEGDASLCDIF